MRASKVKANSDIQLGNNVSVAYATRYGRIGPSDCTLDTAISTLVACRGFLIKSGLIKTVQSPHIRIGGLKKRTLNGQYYNYPERNNGTIVISPLKRSLNLMIEYLCHEMVHHEQYRAGRLSQVNGLNVWNDGVSQPYVRNMQQSISYTKYRNLPWEVEAFERQVTLAKEFHEFRNGRYEL